MSIGIGIDTGGTYTDAVAYDFSVGKVLAKGKALTTREDLSIGIGNALDALPIDLLRRATLLSLSTTLATNACVENKGGRSKLILIGGSEKLLQLAEAEKLYGICTEDVLCVKTDSSYDGRVVDEPDWDAVSYANDAWLSDAHAIGIADMMAVRNGGVSEKIAQGFICGKYSVPTIIASELVSGLNVMERGATALLNARLLPVIEEFHKAIKTSLKKRGLSIPTMTVRSDGSLMSDVLSCQRPVETILSGPAASVLGGRSFSASEDCLIVDMGGTTTDISIVEGGKPAMTGGIKIGGWRTQVKGVFIDTFGLGGDSRIVFGSHGFELSERRVEPICVAATKFPEVKEWLRELLLRDRCYAEPQHEFLYLIREPDGNVQYNQDELELVARLRNGPIMPGRSSGDWYRIRPDRLENERIVMRCGLTPTDIMHIKGDFSHYDKEASALAARYFLRAISDYDDDEIGLEKLCANVYDSVEKSLYVGIVRALLEYRDPKQNIRNGDQLSSLINSSWNEQKRRGYAHSPFFGYSFNTRATLVGIGAPTHLFLHRVAEALGTSVVLPSHAEVANALGAVLADIAVTVTVEVAPCYSANGLDGYIAHCHEGNRFFETSEEAVAVAIESARSTVYLEARERGALGELTVSCSEKQNIARSKDGSAIDLGTVVTAVASGRVV